MCTSSRVGLTDDAYGVPRQVDVGAALWAVQSQERRGM